MLSFSSRRHKKVFKERQFPRRSRMEKEQKGSDFKHIVRIAGADLPGGKQLVYALRKISGVGFLMANALCKSANIDRFKRAGDLSDQEIGSLNEVLNKPELPAWMKNRRFEPETGEDKHLFGIDVRFTKDNDIKQMRKMKSYKGFRHSKGLPVRGQRTKSNFRKNKGKSLGVSKKKR